MARDIEIVITRYQNAIQKYSTKSEIVLRNGELICGLAQSMETNESNSNTNNPLNELHEVFSNLSVKEENSCSSDVDSLLLNTDILLPLPILTSPDKGNGIVLVSQADLQKKPGLSDLDKLSADLLKEQLDAIHEKKTLRLTKL